MGDDVTTCSKIGTNEIQVVVTSDVGNGYNILILEGVHPDPITHQPAVACALQQPTLRRTCPMAKLWDFPTFASMAA
jgi:hypothetical protein